VVYKGMHSHIDSLPFLYAHDASLKDRVPTLSTRKLMSSPFTKGDPSCIEGTATPFLIDCAHRYAHLGEHEVHDGGIWWSLLE